MKRFKIHISILLLLHLFCGCKKFVELDAPKTQLVTNNVFASDETASAALLGIYAQMVDNDFTPYKIANYTGLAADELITYTTVNLLVYQNSLRPSDAVTNSIWTNAYSFIYQANAVYEGCNNSTTLSTAAKKQIMAEAIFLRSYWYFYLINLYGDVPLLLTSDYTKNATIGKTSQNDIYNQISNDLKSAENDLSENYVGANSISTGTERIRANKYAAAALLARVYLYQKKYPDAEAQATIVLNNKTLYDLVDLTQVFLKNTKENILQIPKPSPTNNFNTYEGSYFILTSKPGDNFINSSVISDRLMYAFDSADKRKSAWVGTFTDNSVTPSVNYNYPYKYKAFNTATISEYSTVLRVGEQYLIRAEARANQSNLSGAISDIDMIRNRAGLPLIANTNPGINQTDLITAILKERQVELFAEWGHRWMDLKRTGNINSVMSVVTPAKGGPAWNSNMQLWPIPQTDIATNPNLKQNQGYN
ncbi:RagB/SusD family nutrient uptake outer membrane protein [Chitinophaga sancti]|uniref:RagB/SusD family nutrient uptake outer membrane protein n=1 Tax=Chitinophaga sancti TaxID=1004 RepID=UPI002A751098|nr:RagB/SusD family nutrient uptake outer membrane protein [Chitinophaga sancti]WPQ61909.1 RagB/SusD family nutrient uptake outer membrane protein [Chitinophaga sancti]